MPIKPENRDRYPANWPEVRARILARAEVDRVPQCEMTLPAGEDLPKPVRCGAPNGLEIDRNGFLWWGEPGGTRVVLTIAHLDQQPEHNDDANLMALCQRCHLTYDATWRRMEKERGEAPTVDECMTEWRARYSMGGF